MTEFQIAGLYIGLLMLLMLALAINVVRHRSRSAISLGTGEDEKLEQACRTHANFVEYGVPAMAGLLALAAVGAGPLFLHGFGATMLVGRILHAQGLLSVRGRSFGRLVGTLLTWLAVLGMGGMLVLSAF